MERNGLIIIFYTIFIVQSCSLSILSGDENLGKGYILWTEGKNGSSNCIIRSTTESYQGTGLQVIPPTVINVNHNEKIIIVLSKDLETGQNLFWVINKEIPINMKDCIDQVSCDRVLKSNLEGPLDSIAFYRLLESKGIELRFDD